MPKQEITLDLKKVVQREKPYTPAFTEDQVLALFRFTVDLALDELDEETRAIAERYGFREGGKVYHLEIEKERVDEFERWYGFDKVRGMGTRSAKVGALACYGHGALPDSSFYAVWRGGEESERHLLLRFEQPFEFDDDDYHE